MWSLPRLCIACLLAVPTILDLPELFTGWEERWEAVVALLDLWYVRLALLVAAGILLTYPQWARAIRTRLDIPAEQTLWGGLQFRYGWGKAKWEEKRQRRKREREFKRRKKHGGGA